MNMMEWILNLQLPKSFLLLTESMTKNSRGYKSRHCTFSDNLASYRSDILCARLTRNTLLDCQVGLGFSTHMKAFLHGYFLNKML